MTDAREDGLRRALRSGADEFVPGAPLGATRDEVVGRVRRRHRQLASLAATAVAIVVVAGVVVSGIGRSPGSSSRLVVAGGAGRSAGSTVPPTTSVGPAGTSASSSTIASGAALGSTTSPPTTRLAVPLSTSVPPTTFVTTVPTTTTVPSSFGSSVQGNVTFSPTCPVERIPPDPACAARPGPAHIQLVRNGSVAAEGDAGANGLFVIAVAPGGYDVVATTLPGSGAIGRGCTATPSHVVVNAGVTSPVAVSCDTGIR